MATAVPPTETEQTMQLENDKKRGREHDAPEGEPSEKKPRLSIDTTTPTSSQPNQNTSTSANTPTTATTDSAKPKSRLALLEKLKSKVSSIDNVIKSTPEVTPAPVLATTTVPNGSAPAPTTNVSPPKTRGGKKAGASTKRKSTKKENLDFIPGSDEDEEQEAEERPRRQRRASKYTVVDYDSDTTRALSEGMKKCYKLLTQLKNHKWAWPFLTPVDPIALGIPDYYTIIKRPMDLGTIEQKLLNGEYADIYGFADDVELVWSNCFTYNQPESDVVKMAQAVKSYFDERFRKLSEEHVRDSGAVPPPNRQLAEMQEKVQSLESQLERLKKTPATEQVPKIPAASARANQKKRVKKTTPVDTREMTFEEKKRLSDNIEKLTAEKLTRVVQIIQNRAPKASSQANEQEIEIDLDKLDAVTLRELERYVRSCLSAKKRTKKKPTPAAQVAVAEQVPVEAPQIVPAAVTPAAAPAKKEEESGSGTDESSSDEESSDDSSSESDGEGEKKPPVHDPTGPQSLSAQAIA
jgi:hypothetical protein